MTSHKLQLRVLQMWPFALQASRGVPGRDSEQVVDGVWGAECAGCVEEQTSLAFQGKGLKFLMWSIWVPPLWAGQALPAFPEGTF